MKKQYHNDIFI